MRSTQPSPAVILLWVSLALTLAPLPTSVGAEETAEPASWLEAAQREAVTEATPVVAPAKQVAPASAGGRALPWIMIAAGTMLALSVALIWRRRPPVAPAASVGDGSGRRLVTAPGSTQLQLIRDPESSGTRPAVKPPTIHMTRRIGFTMVEVMIAVAIMATALSALVSTVYTLNQAHQGNKETAKAQEIAQVLIERLQGASWHALGRRMSTQSDLNAWSWHRRDGAAATEPRPLAETDNVVVDMTTYHLAINNPLTLDPNLTATGFDLARAQAIRAANGLAANRPLRGLGLWGGASALGNLNVYVEYYDMAVCTDALSGDWQCNSRTDWATRRANPGFVLERDPMLVDLTEVRNAVVFRVLLRWDSISGAPRTHEVAFARRR